MRVQNADSMAAVRQRDVFQALARFCSQVSGEAVTEEHVRRFTFRDWRKYTQVGATQRAAAARPA